MTLNPDFVLIVFCASMFGALERGFRSMASLILVTVVGELNRKEHLRHRAVSLQQHGFLVNYKYSKNYNYQMILFVNDINQLAFTHCTGC